MCHQTVKLLIKNCAKHRVWKQRLNSAACVCVYVCVFSAQSRQFEDAKWAVKKFLHQIFTNKNKQTNKKHMQTLAVGWLNREVHAYKNQDHKKH